MREAQSSKTPSSFLHVHTTPPGAPQTLRPKCAVVFTYSGSHRLRVLLAALQGTNSAPQQGALLTGVWAGRTFRAEALALTSSI